ncbi:MAG TPA: phosphoglucomutase/phosphomannomutase family protein, partial [Leptolinea sp.]
MTFQIHFGTDGWRGVIAEEYTFDNVRRCSQGYANYMIATGNKGKWFIVGHDKRFGSENFALAAAEVMAGNGLKVYLTNDATPTPVIAFSVVHRNAAGAINITASHNPPSDNGFKVRNFTGGAIDPQGLVQIEKGIPDSMDDVKRMPSEEAFEKGMIVKFDPAPDYLKHLKDLIDVEPIKQAGLKIIVDTMWGNGAGWFTEILGGGKTQITEIHNTRNPSFPEMKRPEPIPPNINVGLQKTVDTKSDVLVITDGDADRVGIGDENGNFVNQLQVYALLAYYLLEIRKQR